MHTSIGTKFVFQHFDQLFVGFFWNFLNSRLMSPRRIPMLEHNFNSENFYPIKIFSYPPFVPKVFPLTENLILFFSIFFETDKLHPVIFYNKNFDWIGHHVKLNNFTIYYLWVIAVQFICIGCHENDILFWMAVF